MVIDHFKTKKGATSWAKYSKKQGYKVKGPTKKTSHTIKRGSHTAKIKGVVYAVERTRKRNK